MKIRTQRTASFYSRCSRMLLELLVTLIVNRQFAYLYPSVSSAGISICNAHQNKERRPLQRCYRFCLSVKKQSKTTTTPAGNNCCCTCAATHIQTSLVKPFSTPKQQQEQQQQWTYAPPFRNKGPRHDLYIFIPKVIELHLGLSRREPLASTLSGKARSPRPHSGPSSLQPV